MVIFVKYTVYGSYTENQTYLKALIVFNLVKAFRDYDSTL